jgi:opacity protein-like surface antigen
MGSMLNRMVMSALGGALVASPASAQIRFPVGSGSSRPISIAFGGGVSVPTGDYKQAFKNGYNGQGSIIFNLPGFPAAFRADLNYNKFSIKNGLSSFGLPSGASPTDVSQQVLGGLANITIPFRMGPIAPYVTGGVGAFSMKTNYGGTYSGTDSSQTKFAIDGGAGLSVKLFGLSAFIEGKINNIYTEKGTIAKESVKFIPVTFGIVF